MDRTEQRTDELVGPLRVLGTEPLSGLGSGSSSVTSEKRYASPHILGSSQFAEGPDPSGTVCESSNY